ncbi:prepilin peptidase [Alkaliphilus sp. B6464]|uniref:prepilin peptidase n=1 Tax=Alkaliphilus sp. B6464 TaxID=2731219 RepID=UPI001BAADB13|nr:A24 family peptidase [Alkaliphilus sp. B6464]QUH20397.1 prepilin peptidase [Alkaliphilus sp. B6464]
MRELYRDYLKPLSIRWKILLIVLLIMVNMANLLIRASLDKILICNVLVVITILDIRYLKIPNALIVFLLGLSVSSIAIVGDINSIISRILAFFSISVLMVIYSLVSGIGGGDVKLISVLSLIFGFKETFLIFALSTILGAVASLFLILIKKVKLNTKVPLSPFIVVVTMFFLH